MENENTGHIEQSDTRLDTEEMPADTQPEIINKPEIAGIEKFEKIISNIEKQMDSSFGAYETIVKQLNVYRDRGEIHTETPSFYKDPLSAEMATDRIKRNFDIKNRNRGEVFEIPALSKESLKSELQTWLTEDKLNYIDQAVGLDPELRFTLIATPNIPVNADEITVLAIDYGESSKPEVRDNDDFFRINSKFYEKYTAEQLSGYDAEGSDVKFKLIPSKFTSGFKGNVNEQREKLAAAQVDNPFLCVPSVLDDLVYWQTLRVQKNDNSISDVPNLKEEKYTYNRHFDLETIQDKSLIYLISGRLALNEIPYSTLLEDAGIPVMDHGDIDVKEEARIAIG